MRTPSLLAEVAAGHPRVAKRWTTRRAAVAAAVAGDLDAAESALLAEELAERALDRAYWKPLVEELAALRKARTPSRRRRRTSAR